MNAALQPNTGDDLPLLRKTEQYLMPAQLEKLNADGQGYSIYPVTALGDQKIFNGYDSLTAWIITQKTVLIDGYAGVYWDRVQQAITNCLAEKGLRANWIDTSDYFKENTEIDALVAPFLGTEDAVWGTKCTLTLSDLFQAVALSALESNPHAEINILIGTGAALANWEAPLLYIDLPKNELQFRMRAGAITNLGTTATATPAQMYKRFYFVDWVLLNQHKKAILHQIDVVADGQWADQINWMYGADLFHALNRISTSVIRVRPWFEPGAWGGQWIKKNIPQLNPDVVNYAWSFELIVPENGLVFESGGNLLEVSFDMLMFHNQQQVLGRHAAVFGAEFPIRFDFLDTVDGGNLSIQCHPRLSYIQEHFGENITQDETYYILDCEQDTTVYLGFQENIQPQAFKEVLEDSQKNEKVIQITDYVQAHVANQHDLFLIPNGTVHSAGKGNLVLEISATPYIFTFKMYDWLRLDLEGKPRPINIEHAFRNLDFARKGKRVTEELISKPTVIAQEGDWQIIHLPTHQDHFYDVHRLEFDHQILVQTYDSCHVLMLVEGTAISIETKDGTTHRYAYAETFVIPAAAESYTLTNLGEGRTRVIKAFLK